MRANEGRAYSFVAGVLCVAVGPMLGFLFWGVALGVALIVLSVFGPWGDL